MKEEGDIILSDILFILTHFAPTTSDAASARAYGSKST